jgi:hypothetical protein
MTFLNELEVIIQSTYLKVLGRHHIRNINGKTLNCDSFQRIIAVIKNVLVVSSNNGLLAFETANNIIFKLLNDNLFIYENHEMAVLIGYIYLKRQGVKINNYTLDGITNKSTLDEIRIVTASW